MTYERTILFFVKAPRRGAVKSRLSGIFGEDAALALYRNFVLDMLDTLVATAIPVSVHVHPPDGVTEVSAWLGSRCRCVPQTGADLGERMEHAFIEVFRSDVRTAVLIGSDIPDLPANHLREAFRLLDDHDAVIGPAADGGYYLIGFRRETFCPETFRGTVWSTPAVFGTTMRRLQDCRRSVGLLPTLHDVDTMEDLRALYRRNRSTAFARSRTMVYLDEQRRETGPAEESDADL